MWNWWVSAGEAGGRDLMAGGTWLAVNDHGVVAGLTNKPAEEGRDPSKRSRGEIPLALTSTPSMPQDVPVTISSAVSISPDVSSMSFSSVPSFSDISLNDQTNN